MSVGAKKLVALNGNHPPGWRSWLVCAGRTVYQRQGAHKATDRPSSRHIALELCAFNCWHSVHDGCGFLIPAGWQWSKFYCCCCWCFSFPNIVKRRKESKYKFRTAEMHL